LLEEKCGPASSALGIRISASFEQKPNNLQYLQSAKALPSHQRQDNSLNGMMSHDL
jgi:hypothetical protein